MFQVMKLYINTGKKQIISIEVNKEERIREVKDKIQGNSNGGEHFFLIYNQITLEDEKVISDYSIHDQSTLYMARSREKQVIFIKQVGGETFQLHVECNQPIMFVKKQIETEHGILSSQQRIIFAGKQLEDHRTICDYSIQKESTLHLVLQKVPVQLLIKLASGGQIQLNVESSDKIFKIKQQIYEASGIAIKQQCLSFQEKQLEDEDQLQDYNISNVAIIQLTDNGIEK